MTSAAVVFAMLAADPVGVVGKIRVSGSGPTPVVSVVVAEKPVLLQGAYLDELQRLQSTTVEVLGQHRGDVFEVQDYRIVDVGGGARPLVGTIVRVGEDLALRDGEGAPIPLALPSRSKERLLKAVQGKVWVFGEKLVSGQLKVLRYGILKDPPPAQH